jgi:hypothetical protein
MMRGVRTKLRKITDNDSLGVILKKYSVNLRILHGLKRITVYIVRRRMFHMLEHGKLEVFLFYFLCLYFSKQIFCVLHIAELSRLNKKQCLLFFQNSEFFVNFSSIFMVLFRKTQ